jgi:hypothetical protein
MAVQITYHAYISQDGSRIAVSKANSGAYEVIW